MPNMTMDALAEVLRSARTVLLTTHACPDGDGIGSVAAMSRILEAGGRTARALLPDPIPARYRFLDPENLLHHPGMPEEAWHPLLQGIDLLLVLDTHHWGMLGSLTTPLQALGCPVRFLDHHPMSGDPRPEVLSDPKAASAGELVYRLVHDSLGWEIPREAAEAIYVSISSDTNSFKYIRSNESSLLIAADLVRLGVDTNRVYRHLFASNSQGKARLLGYVMSNVQFEAGGRLASVKIPCGVIRDLQLERDEMRDSITQILEIQGVEVAVTLKETEPGEINTSIRSKGACDINGVAVELGGGGHALAAGVDLTGDLNEAWERVRPPLLRQLESLGSSVQEIRSPHPPSPCGPG